MSTQLQAPAPILTARRALSVLLAGLVLWWASGSGWPTVAQTGPEDPGVARAVADLIGPGRAAGGFSRDVVAGLGVAPVAERGPGGHLLLTDPRGGCSVPTPARPLLEPGFDGLFAALCRSHDLGYNLLRLAARRGGALGPWAREAIDRRFAADLFATCGAQPACRTVAAAAAAFVRVNSWRQGEGVPVVETPTRTVVAALLAGSVLAVGLRRPLGWRRRFGWPPGSVADDEHAAPLTDVAEHQRERDHDPVTVAQ